MTFTLKRQTGTQEITETVEGEEVTREVPVYETVLTLDDSDPTAALRINQKKRREERLNPGTYVVETVE
jgi:hypothetical protein